MDRSHNRQNFENSLNRKIHYHSVNLKRVLKLEKITKFGCEML